MKTAMQKHLEWLKARMTVTPEMERTLLDEEKLQILNAYDAGLMEQGHSVDYYNQTYNTYKQD